MNYYFLLAIISSALGPFLYSAISSHKKTSRFIDGLTVMALVSLVALHIIPESLEHAGITTIIAVILGLVGPLFFSRLTRRTECEIQKPFLIITILGFLAHNMLDGAALIFDPHAPKSTHLLALAVVIHRLLVSMALWKTLLNSFSIIVSSLAIAGMTGAMALGYFFGEGLISHMEADILHILQSLACGMLFHVLLHPHHIKELLKEAKNSSFLIKIQSAGALCGLILAVLAYLFWPAHNHGTAPHSHTSMTHEQHRSH